MFRKLGGGFRPFWGGGAGSLSNTKSPGLRPTSIPSSILIHPAIWPQQIWAENWGLCPFGGGELGPHLTQCGQGRGLPACQVSSSSIQPFGHSTTTSQTGQTGQRTDNIGRTVLQTVAQKLVAVFTCWRILCCAIYSSPDSGSWRNRLSWLRSLFVRVLSNQFCTYSSTIVPWGMRWWLEGFS